MTPKEQLIESLRLLCKREGGYKPVADKAGLDDQSIYQVTSGVRLPSGNPKGVGPSMQTKLSSAYPGWDRLYQEETARELAKLKLDGGEIALDSPNVEDGPAIKGRGRYPVISWVQAGEWTALCDNFQPGDAEDWRTTHHNLGKHGYVLRVSGPSMTAPGGEFSFPHGMLLYVNPDKDPLPGQFVIVRREHDKEAVFKRYVIVDGSPFLEAINPDWPTRYLPLKEGDFFCGVVVDASFGNLP